MQSSESALISSAESQTQYTTLFSKCIKIKNLKLGGALHSHLIKSALIFNTFLTNRLIQMYSKCNSIDSAQKVFNELQFKNQHSWNSLISAYSQMARFNDARQLLEEMPGPNLVSHNSILSSLTLRGFYKEAISVFRRMQNLHRDVLWMDEYTIVGLTNTCASLAALALLRQVHGVAIAVGLHFNLVVCNALIDAYGKCGLD
ncbi:unnamed protein product [Fraxinus pennsylvanica]|uniref:Pentatricopeptide repeat-containing protein n=1 Tax=Fraxinus pennsylvanica TaxID=56036 RepID=A0AAD1Z555_9LAMI|nr:unnamed protein product [Fraxinus pennsylvanica]